MRGNGVSASVRFSPETGESEVRIQVTRGQTILQPVEPTLNEAGRIEDGEPGGLAWLGKRGFADLRDIPWSPELPEVRKQTLLDAPGPDNTAGACWRVTQELITAFGPLLGLVWSESRPGTRRVPEGHPAVFFARKFTIDGVEELSHKRIPEDFDRRMNPVDIPDVYNPHAFLGPSNQEAFFVHFGWLTEESYETLALEGRGVKKALDMTWEHDF